MTSRSSSFAMTQGRRLNQIHYVAAVLATFAMSACASSRPALIVYANAANPPTVIDPLAPPASAPLDLSTLPYDAASAPIIIGDLPPSECVPFARNTSGLQIWGDAVTWWAQAESHYVRSGRPAEGSVLVLKGYEDATRGHVAVVKAIISDRLIRVDHANWLAHGEVSLNVPVVDVSERNDWSEVRVWHIPGSAWGGRTYSAEGFIHPFRLDGGAGISG